MKKREKFLLSVVISFVVVMVIYIMDATKYANYNANTVIYKFENGLQNYINFVSESLTEEGLEFYEQEANKFVNGSSEEKIAIIAEYWNADDLSEHFVQLNAANSKAIEALGVFSVISWLTLIIYSIFTIEFKNKKQYFIDNVKIILSIVILFMLVFCIQYLQLYIINNKLDEYMGTGYSWDDIIQQLSWDIMSILDGTIATFILIFIPNVIINIIKNKKKKRVSAESKQQ